PGALIPRPETEALVDMAVERAAGRDGARILDVGTGSGCIALAIKSALPSARVTAIDASPDALRVAQANAQTLALDVDIRLVDILSPEAANIGQFDIVVSNPPYVRLSESCSMDTNVLDHEPRMALFVPDDDPLLFYRRIARLSLGGMLAPGGSLLFEINEALGPQTARMLTSLGLRDAAISPDFTGRDRYASCSRQSTTN
ncbi:peptide chain release factor N(5)-glutamine methyltransferase, partial [Salmonella enterica]|nr:peptide chain release factor N(5)-glutamine methyltransferase [Salmonella enterica]